MPSTAAVNFEVGREGNVSVPDQEGIELPSCDSNTNMTAAVDGIWAASGFMIDESRLTFIGTTGETVGFRATL